MSSKRHPPAIYLDFNASTPLAPEVVAAMTPYLTGGYGNPSTSHWAAAPARDALATARTEVAELLGCPAAEVVFTSGGSEANNLAIKGVVLASSVTRPHVITTAVEHPSVLETCRALERRGARVTYLPVDSTGRVDPADVRDALDSRTVLISVMWANNEVGTLQPIREIREIAAEHGVPFHSDAAQAAGKIPLSDVASDVDLVTVAGHKLYGPKGVGALRIRTGLRLEAQIHGGGQEHGLRSGTESALLVAGLGAACRLANRDLDADRIKGLRDRFWSRLSLELGPALTLNGHSHERLPNTLNVSVKGWRGSELLSRLDGVAASTGSACHEGLDAVSPVLAAMALDRERALGAIRFSLGRTTTEAEIDHVGERLAAVVRRRLP